MEVKEDLMLAVVHRVTGAGYTVENRGSQKQSPAQRDIPTGSKQEAGGHTKSGRCERFVYQCKMWTLCWCG